MVELTHIERNKNSLFSKWSYEIFTKDHED